MPQRSVPSPMPCRYQADDLGRDALRRIVLQAKHSRVGEKAGSNMMYGVKGTVGPAHRADPAEGVTNDFRTRDAVT
ncbi:hypothetical protein RGQ21_00130 [Kitasatospora aureofaciens]|nr:hypothetical protein RGQ21_00130 [Kitasatospora aureofaciens]